MSGYYHKPVMPREVMELLDLKRGMTVVDCTVGGGGHARLMLRSVLPSGFLVGIDQDPEAIEAANATLKETLKDAAKDAAKDAVKDAARDAMADVVKDDMADTIIDTATDAIADAAEDLAKKPPFILIHSNFSRIKEIMRALGIQGADRALIDLGVSSHQLDEAERGFSYQRQGDLDMRMNTLSDGPKAGDIVMNSDAKELERIFSRYGEERWSRRIAEFIVRERENSPIRTTADLVEIIKKAIPAAARRDGPHPAKRCFQALRIHINNELDILEQAIADLIEILKPGGRLAVISFHSLEDRIVKETFRKNEAACACPRNMPVCVCGNKKLGRALTRKPVLPGDDEVVENPRSASAKLRVFEKGVA